MRPFIALVLTASLFCGAVSAAEAAEYKVRPGDTIDSISRHTGFTTQQLVLMNSMLMHPERPMPGQKMRYVSKRDMADAIKWCAEQLKRQPPPDEGDARVFSETIVNLKAGKIRYSHDELEGTFFWNIFVFADGWREENPKHEPKH